MAVRQRSREKNAQFEQQRIPFRAMGPFLMIAFGLAWGILGLFIFLPDPMNRIFGELSARHPLFYLAVYAPAIAAFIIVMRHGGTVGFKRYVARVMLWRCSPIWYLFLIVGIPLLFLAGAAWKGSLATAPVDLSSPGALLAAMAFAMVLGPVEEFGWRGLALPLLQRKAAPIWAGLILGSVWGAWHLPAFLLNGTQQSDWSFSAFFVGCIALSIIVTALFNASRGSILLSAFFHFAVMNPMLPDAQPYDTVLLAVVAVMIMGFNRRGMFTRQGAVTEVMPVKQFGGTR